MYQVKYTKQFEKDLRLCMKRGYDLNLFRDVASILAQEGKLPSIYYPHKLSGKYKDRWECHIKSDWLLVWKQNDEELVLLFTNTGTHSDLF